MKLNVNENDKLNQIIKTVIETGQTSATFIQRKFKMNYEEAKVVVNQMEEIGIISKLQADKPRQVLVTQEEWEKISKDIKFKKNIKF